MEHMLNVSRTRRQVQNAFIYSFLSGTPSGHFLMIPSYKFSLKSILNANNGNYSVNIVSETKHLVNSRYMVFLLLKLREYP